MHRYLAAPLYLALSAMAAVAQTTLPQIAGAQGELRALNTMDEAADWEAVGRVDTPVSFCSGTLIAPDLVLTAAHCLFDEAGARLPATSLSFAASLRNDRAVAVRAVQRAVRHPDYTNPTETARDDALARDIAILELARPIPVQMVRPIGTGAAGHAHDRVTVVSYGDGRESHASIEDGCTILAEDGDILILDCNAVSGSSGAPILRINQGQPEIIAVVSATAEWQGMPVSVGVAVEDLLPDLLALMRDTVGPARLPGTVRRVLPGESGREGIGARFIRP